MAHLNLYKPDGNWCYRLVRPADGVVVDYNADTTGASVSKTTTTAHSAIPLTYNGTGGTNIIGGFPITIPANLPDGEWDMILHNVAAAALAATDEAYLSRRFNWVGGRIVGHMIKFLDI